MKSAHRVSVRTKIPRQRNAARFLRGLGALSWALRTNSIAALEGEKAKVKPDPFGLQPSHTAAAHTSRRTHDLREPKFLRTEPVNRSMAVRNGGRAIGGEQRRSRRHRGKELEKVEEQQR